MRFFELMIGGLLALLIAHQNSKVRTYSELCYGIGFLLIGGALFLLNKSSHFPGINALWPCLGAALIIWAGNNPIKTSRIFTNRPMVFIGLISYSLYLWHWPIIAYLNYMDIPITLSIGITVIITAILLAWLSWKYVEIPMRQSGAALPFGQTFARRFAMPVTALLSIGAATSYNQGFPSRFDPRVAEFEKTLAAKPEDLRSGCHVQNALYNTPPDPNKCRIGATKPELDGILIGDSLANHYTGMLDVMGKDSNVNLMDFTMDGCPPIMGYKTNKTPAYEEKCRKRVKTAFALIDEKRFRRVVLAGTWPKEPEAGKHVMDSIGYILNTGAKVTVITQNQRIERAESCAIRNMMYKSAKNCDAVQQQPPKYILDIPVIYPQVQVIDPNKAICNQQTCRPVIDNTLLYRDEVHLNDIGSRLIGKILLSMGVKL